MKLRGIEKCERSRIDQWAAFQLDYKWKKIGVIFSLVITVVLLIQKFSRPSGFQYDTEHVSYLFFLERFFLIGLLIIIVSKDKIEDEMITSIRARSFKLAFICAVLYAVIQPFVNALVFYVLAKDSMGYNSTYFQVLTFMLMLQILFFEVLKRNR